MDPNYEINKLLIPDKTSMACQTDESAALKIARTCTEDPCGIYPCRIGTCNFNRQFDLLMNHLKTDHADHFLQVCYCCLSYDNFAVVNKKIHCCSFQMAMELDTPGPLSTKTI